MVTVDEARIRAEAYAKEVLKIVTGDTKENVLQDGYTEIDSCFIFYRKPEIYIPVEFRLGRDVAFLVSKVYPNKKVFGAADWRGHEKESEMYEVLSKVAAKPDPA